jgi:hypothetical protein
MQAMLLAAPVRPCELGCFVTSDTAKLDRFRNRIAAERISAVYAGGHFGGTVDPSYRLIIFYSAINSGYCSFSAFA